MIAEVHITADSDFWTGASTRALLLARRVDADSMVVSNLPAELSARFLREGVKAEKCRVSGWLGPLNLSRVLRRIPGDDLRVFVHSSELIRTVENAIKLAGRPGAVELVTQIPEITFPTVEVPRPAADAEPLYMWLGNIKAGCGLGDVIERLGQITDRRWRLRVVGNGKAAVAVPILKRAKALGIADRIDWMGYSANPYELMAGVCAGIARPDSTALREFSAASIPVITNLSDL